VRTASLSLLTILCMLLAVAPAMADTLYSNGPINGTTDAWVINFGLAVSDSFSTHSYFNRLEELHIGVWLYPGDSVSSVEMQLGSNPFGNDIADQVLAATGSTDLGINQYGADVQQVDFLFSQDIYLFGYGGTYWLTLQNAVETQFGDPVFWDENSGPSAAFENTIGSIASEAFTLTGDNCYWCGGTTPEPSSILLFGSGILGLAGVLRRKLGR
jgi:hypothetical protein